ncbi:MAG: exosortase F system-associated protein [Cyclobacteriaceae bacterium]
MIKRIIIGALSVIGLVVIFLFQQTDLAGSLGLGMSDINRFIFNRTVRFLLNDGLTIALIYAIFVERKYVLVSFYVQVAGLIFILIPYFILKTHYPLYNGPLINFIHRLVLNPLLLMLLIPAFYYQQHNSSK